MRAVARRGPGPPFAVLSSGLAVLLGSPSVQAQSLLTAAGRSNDAILATVYPVGYPSKLATGPNGDVFITDPTNGRVLKVAGATGILSVLAGTGIQYPPEGAGPATASPLIFPAAVGVDPAGNVLIGEGYQPGLYRVSPTSGVLTPLTTDTTPSMASLAVDDQGNVFLSDWRANQIRKLSPTGQLSVVAGNGEAGFSGDGGPATQARLDFAAGHSYGGLAVRGGSVYVADFSNHRVRVVSPDGVIRTIAGRDAATQDGDGGPATLAGLGRPADVAFGPDGSLYVACLGVNEAGRIRRVAPNGTIETFAGGGSASGYGIPATSSSLYAPTAVAVMPNGDLLISEGSVDRVRLSDRTLVPFAGPRPRDPGDGVRGKDSTLGYPSGVAVDASGSLLVADLNDGRVRRVDGATGLVQTFAGGGPHDDGVPATQSGLCCGPSQLAVDRSGNVFIGTSVTQLVWKVSSTTGLVSKYAGSCCGGSFGEGDGGPATLARLWSPEALAIDGAGLLYIANGPRVQRVRADGVLETVAGGSSGSGSLGDGGPATQAHLQDVAGLAVSPAGDLYLSERGKHRIRKVSGGIIRPFAGTGVPGFSGDGGPALSAQLRYPEGLWLDASGNLLVADAGNGRVRRITPGGIVTTVTGNGSVDAAGDGTPATAAGLPTPRTVALGPRGELYAATPSNGRVRVVFPCTSPAQPAPFEPADGTLLPVGTDGVALRWTPASGAFSYDVYLDTVNPPKKVVQAGVPFDTATPFSAPPSATTGVTVSSLQPKTTYYWRVVARGDPACPGLSAASSPTVSFTVPRDCSDPDPFGPTAPAAGSVVSPASVTLTWSPSDGAGRYDVYLSATNPPRLYRSNLTATTLTATGLSPSTTYSWYVVAYAQCDQTRATGSPGASFTTSGPCADVGPVALVSPAAGATVASSTTLAWSTAAGASSYDVYLGRTGDPALYQAGLTSTTLSVSGLARGGSYVWKVVARSACDPAKSSTTPVGAFTVSGSCGAPPTPAFYPAPGAVGVGHTYVVAFSQVALDPGGAYLVERSLGPGFSPVLDSQLTTGSSAAFVATTVGTYYHRVWAVAGCDPQQRSGPSAALAVQVVDGQPVVVFTKPPRALVAPTGPGLDTSLFAVDPEQAARLFTIQNISTKPVSVIVAVNAIGGSPNFFQVDDPRGGSPYFGLALQPQETRQLHLSYSGVPSDAAASYQGVVYLVVPGQQIVPYAYVNLKLGGQDAVAPVFLRGGTPIEYAAFDGFPATEDDAARPPLSVDVQNPGTAPMELAAEIGPEVWLEPEAGWNATPIAPGASRTLRLRTHRGRALAGSVLPRYTYLTLRTRDGNTARLLVQDSDLPAEARDPRAVLPRGASSYIVPSIVHATSRIGSTFVSRLRLSSASSDDTQVELVYTPAGADGFDSSAVRRLKLTVPHNDVVALTDPLVQLFGLTPPAVGQLEVRADPARLGAITVTSAVDAPSATGGTFGFQLPILGRGDGASLGQPQVVPAITLDATYRSNVILAETTGLDAASVTVALYDAGGAKLGEKSTTVARYGQTQFALSDLLGPASSLAAGLIEIGVTAGGGTVAAVVTVIDNVNDDASTFVSRPATAAAAPAALVARFGKARTTAQGRPTRRLGVPALVNGYATFPGSDQPYTFRSQLFLTSATLESSTFTLVYTDLVKGGQAITRTVVVPGRGTVSFDNVLEQLFGIPPGQRSQGPMTVDAEMNGLIATRVYSRLGSGTLGDAFPLITLPPQSAELVTGAGFAHPLGVDGLEQSVDASRGTRSNLILNEWIGQPATVTVRLFEAGNRARPIVEQDVDLAPYEKKQLSTLFAGLGLDTDERRKDRTNVLCVVAPKSGGGMVSGVVTTIDNRTGDTRNSVLTPSGAVAGGGVGIGR